MKRELHVISGTIFSSCSPLKYQKKDGTDGVKGMLWIKTDEGTEMAIEVRNDLVNYVGCMGMRVKVSYLVRVAECNKRGKNWFCNDIYAVTVERI